MGIVAAFADTPAGTVVVFGIAVGFVWFLRRSGPGGWKRLFGGQMARDMQRTGDALRNTPLKSKHDSPPDDEIGI